MLMYISADWYRWAWLQATLVVSGILWTTSKTVHKLLPVFELLLSLKGITDAGDSWQQLRIMHEDVQSKFRTFLDRTRTGNTILSAKRFIGLWLVVGETIALLRLRDNVRIANAFTLRKLTCDVIPLNFHLYVSFIYLFLSPVWFGRVRQYDGSYTLSIDFLV